jgi:hypothetical protein
MQEQSSDPDALVQGTRRIRLTPSGYVLTGRQLASGAAILFLAGAAWGAGGLYLYQSRPKPCDVPAMMAEPPAVAPEAP